MNEESKKSKKKKEVLKRNKRNQMIFWQMEKMREDAEGMAAPEIEVKKQEKERNEEDEKVWSAKLQMIRDMNTKRKHMAKERWNRFAGTSGGGGRGL